MADNRNHLSLHYQVVCAIVDGANPFSQEEVSTVRETILSTARTLHFLVESCKVEERWVELRISAETGFDLSKALQVVKGVSSRRLHALRGNAARVWASGYAAVTLGQEMDVATAAARLSTPTRRKETAR